MAKPTAAPAPAPVVEQTAPASGDPLAGMSEDDIKAALDNLLAARKRSRERSKTPQAKETAAAYRQRKAAKDKAILEFAKAKGFVQG